MQARFYLFASAGGVGKDQHFSSMPAYPASVPIQWQ
jgi:hypothetical protein